MLFALGVPVQAQMGTAFTYQGRLLDANGPANGDYDLQFTLYDANTGGSVVGSTMSEPNVTVANGVFMAEVDFGAGVFTGDARWLKIEVRPAGIGNYTVLAPRQRVTPTPYALRALNPPPGWLVTGNAATDPNIHFVGTTDGQPLEFRVNNDAAGDLVIYFD